MKDSQRVIWRGKREKFPEWVCPGLSYLADKDKGLATRPLWTPAEILYQLIDEIYSECWRRRCVKFLHHLTDLEGRVR